MTREELQEAVTKESIEVVAGYGGRPRFLYLRYWATASEGLADMVAHFGEQQGKLAVERAVELLRDFGGLSTLDAARALVDAKAEHSQHAAFFSREVVTRVLVTL